MTRRQRHPPQKRGSRPGEGIPGPESSGESAASSVERLGRTGRDPGAMERASEVGSVEPMRRDSGVECLADGEGRGQLGRQVAAGGHGPRLARPRSERLGRSSPSAQNPPVEGGEEWRILTNGEWQKRQRSGSGSGSGSGRGTGAEVVAERERQRCGSAAASATSCGRRSFCSRGRPETSRDRAPAPRPCRTAQ